MDLQHLDLNALANFAVALSVPTIALVVSNVWQRRSAFVTETTARIRNLIEERDEARADADRWKARALAAEALRV